MVVENMLDDLFKTVTKRFYGEEGAHAHEQPTFKCPRCQHTVLLTVFQEAGKVCPNCRYHARLTAKERLQITADANSFVEYDAELESLDPLSFPNYAEKVAQLQEKTGLERCRSHWRMHHSRFSCSHHYYGFPFYDGIHGQCSRRKNYPCF